MHIQPTQTNSQAYPSTGNGIQNFYSGGAEGVRQARGGWFGYNDSKAVKDLRKTEPEYNDFVSDFEKVQGFFNFYFRKDDNKTLMEIEENRLGKEFSLSCFTKTGNFETELESQKMMNNYPVYSKQDGGKIKFFIKKTETMTDDSNIENTISTGDADTFIGSADIKAYTISKTQEKRFLIELQELFFHPAFSRNIKDLLQVNVNFDKTNSSIKKPKSFNKNSEIGASFSYSADIPKETKSVKDNFEVDYNFTFSELPKNNGYRPRKSDPRIGYFTSSYQNYNNITSDERETVYIQRWNLGKIDPVTKEPERPIKFYIAAGTLPLKNRDKYIEAVKKGVMLWNDAFRRMGIENAVRVEMLPDGADSSNIEYNTINFTYNYKANATGMSQVNPYTGEIYAADVKMSYQLIDCVRNNMLLYDDNLKSIKNDKEREEYIEKNILDYITLLTCHETGHSIGLKHNFKASTYQKDGKYASVMDYYVPNYSSKDGKLYQTELGDYDYLALEYGYKPIDAKTTEEEIKELDIVVQKMKSAGIPYGEDTVVLFDPSCNMHDSGNPLEFCRTSVQKARKIWEYIENGTFEKMGFSHDKITALFNQSIYMYDGAAMLACKYIGGIYYNNTIAGETGGKPVNEPVPASEQREALKFLQEEIFSPTAFNFSAKFLKKLKILGPDYMAVGGDAYSTIAKIQKQAVEYLFSVFYNGKNIGISKLDMLIANEDKYEKDPFTVSEFLETTTKIIWAEIFDEKNANISMNSYKKELQKAYIKKLIDIMQNEKAAVKAIIVVKNLLTKIKNKINAILESEKSSSGGIKVDKDTSDFLRHIADMIKI